MMTPQLFINYKLKSVAHLPWRMLTYKVPASRCCLTTVHSSIYPLPIALPRRQSRLDFSLSS